MGLNEAQVPLMVLQRPTPPTPPDGGLDGGGDAGTVMFDMTAMQGAFYDKLCCVPALSTCNVGVGARPQCCPGSHCQAGTPPDGGIIVGTCIADCKQQWDSCTADAECCPTTGSSTTQAFCDTGFSICSQCSLAAGSCNSDSDCCAGEGLWCDPSNHQCSATCKAQGQPCTEDIQCCGSSYTYDGPSTIECLKADQQCTFCGLENAACSVEAWCCNGLTCGNEHHVCLTCGESLTPCGATGDPDCCLGYTCTGGACVENPG